MSTITKTRKTDETAVLEAAREAVSLSVVKPSDMAGEPANVAAVLDREIRDGFSVVLKSKDALIAMINEAKSQNIHRLLTNPETGKAYRSWAEYMANVMANLDVDFKGMGAKDKAFLIVLLYNTGMSQKGIAKAMTVSPGTVNSAVAKGRELGTVDENRATVGQDGKEYAETNQTKAKKAKTPKVEKSALDKADAHMRTISTLVKEMNADEVAKFKKLVTLLGREVAAQAKATA